MRLVDTFSSLLAFSSTALAQYETTRYYEASTGITYASYPLGQGVIARVALPQQSNSSDAILQIVAQKKWGWCGFAWGGHMTNNPLSVNWPTGSNSGNVGIVSSRMAFGYNALPSAYSGAQYTILKKATTTNSTHWTVTSRCRGCTRYTSADGDIVVDEGDSTTFAYACSGVKPSQPSSNSSSFSQHDTNGIWTHDLRMAKNASYSTWLSKNGLGS